MSLMPIHIGWNENFWIYLQLMLWAYAQRESVSESEKDHKTNKIKE